MLALSRGEGQSIIIDGHIEIKIVKWSRSSVRLAIQAPREVTVDRDEVWRKTHEGELSPLEKAEEERKERFAREGGVAYTPPAPHPKKPLATVTCPKCAHEFHPSRPSTPEAPPSDDMEQ